jgi:hypothetical protein
MILQGHCSFLKFAIDFVWLIAECDLCVDLSDLLTVSVGCWII